MLGDVNWLIIYNRRLFRSADLYRKIIINKSQPYNKVIYSTDVHLIHKCNINISSHRIALFSCFVMPCFLTTTFPCIHCTMQYERTL